jgi:DmsE family decaheme c-type cytochrome
MCVVVGIGGVMGGQPSVDVISARPHCHWGSTTNASVGCRTKFAALILSGIFIALLGNAARPGTLQGPDAAYATLRDYVQSIDAEETPPLAAKGSGARGGAPEDEIHSALRNSVRMIEPDEPASAPSAPFEGAEATHAFAALRQYLHEGKSGEQAPPEQTPPVSSPRSSERGGAPDDEIHSASRKFPRTSIRDDTTSAPVAPFEVAEATNAFDALREFLQKGKTDEQAPPAPAPSKPPTPKAATPKAATLKAAAKPVDATYVGSKVCANCHAAHIETFSVTLMGRLFKQGKLQCETCHGPGSAHAKAGGGRGVGGIISFRADDSVRTPAENNAICLGCHERGARIYWTGSTHDTRSVACTDCHTVMKAVSRKNQLKTAFQPDTCFQCHKDRRAQMFRSSHMPIREGKVVCTDCHNPHGSITEALLKEDSINDTCYKCHAEKRGPFLFEHEPVRENCLACHDAHGTVNEYSLKLSRPRLCFECHGFGHAQGAGPFSQYTMGRACQNCHTQIHGSNSPAGAAFQR